MRLRCLSKCLKIIKTIDANFGGNFEVGILNLIPNLINVSQIDRSKVSVVWFSMLQRVCRLSSRKRTLRGLVLRTPGMYSQQPPICTDIYGKYIRCTPRTKRSISRSRFARQKRVVSFVARSGTNERTNERFANGERRTQTHRLTSYASSFI